MEGCQGKLQRKGFSPNQKAGRCGLETDNSKVCFQAETQQPHICERSWQESKSHVQVINTHDLSGKKKKSVSARERIHPAT